MKFNFFFISYTVMYAKYNHCYEIPKNMPVRYFDGTGWKIMKPRHNLKTKAPRVPNIPKELNWADLIKEIKEIVLNDSITQIPPTCATETKTISTATTTSKTTTTKKATTKKTTPKKNIIKITTPFVEKKKSPLIKPTKTKRANVKHTIPRCILKLKTSPTTTIDPRIWQMKTITSEDWLNIWTRVRPTKKPSSITINKYTTKSPVTSTKKCATKTKVPITKTKEPMTTTKKPDKVSGTQGDGGNGPENWSNLMKEFLKYVDAKKCSPPCDATTMPFSGYKFGAKRLRSNADDLMDILIDGVEIDNKLNEVDDYTSQSTEVMRYKETYETDGEQRFYFDSEEGSVSRDSKINSNDVQDLDNQSPDDSVKFRRINKDEAAAPYIIANYQDYETPRVSQSEAYADEIKVKNEIKYDEILKDNEINSYLEVLIDKHGKKEKYNFGNTRKAQDQDIKNIKQSSAIKNMKIQKYKGNSQYLYKNPLNFKQLNRITDYKATKRTYPIGSTEITDDNEDFLQNDDQEKAD